MKSIRIPKADKPVWVEIKKTQTGKYRFVLKKQKILGLEIPNDSTIGIETVTCEFNANCSMALIPEYNINRLLRYVYIDKLRQGKI